MNPPRQNFQILNKKLGKKSKQKKHEKAAFWTFSEQKGSSCPTNMTSPPVFVVGQHEKHILEPQKSDRAAKIPIFRPFKADFRPRMSSRAQGNMVENGVIRVKKLASDILIRKVILEVRDAEKCVLSLF